MPVFDPEMLNSVLLDFSELMTKCRGALAQFSSTGEAKCFADFSLYIERILEKSRPLNLKGIVSLAHIGKEIGQKGSQVTDQETLFAVLGLLSQLLKQVEKCLIYLQKGQVEPTDEQEVFIAKLKKASEAL